MSRALKPIGRAHRYGMMTVGVAIMVAGFYYFIAPFNLVIGGVSGAGLLFGELLGIPISFFVALLNGVLLLLGWVFLGFKSFKRSLYGSIIFPFILFLLETFSPRFDLPDDYLLAVAFGGFLMGFGFGVVIKYGGTSGGTDIPIKILHKRLNLPLSASIYFVDGIIILAGVIAFYPTNGISGGLYAILTVVVAGKVADMVVLGANRLTNVQIITDQPETIKLLVYEKVSRGVTLVPIEGGYTGKQKTMLITVITKDEYHVLRDIIAREDPHAFVFTNPAGEIRGDFSNRFEEEG